MKMTKEAFDNLLDQVKLSFTEDEKTRLTKDLNQLIEFFDTMNELDTDNIEPMAYIHQLKNIFREDVSVDSGRGQDLLANAPETSHGLYVVPRIME